MKRGGGENLLLKLAQGCYRPEQLTITYDPTLRMPIIAALQNWMDKLWQEKLLIARQKNVPLFDAPLFRLIDATAQPDPFANNHGNISATGEPNLLLYGKVRFGQKWYDDLMAVL